MRWIRWAGVGMLAVALQVAPGQPVGASRLVPPADRTVTLVTGDRVEVGRDGTSVRPMPGKGREGVRFVMRRRDRQVYVLPTDVLPALAAGRLDWRLFDVAGLIEAGLDDARRRDLSLIVRHGAGSRAATTAGVRVVRQLSTLDVTAVRAAKDTAFWAAIRGDAGARVWLDGIRRPVLDRSVPQVGAPAAWQAGYTGAGVRVAVLDSGIDTRHPDLAGRVAAARNFTEAPDHGDTAGHGTHVASTIAGSGAASGGRYRGVAPDATLLDGKVCTEFCDESAILAGMEWAAVEMRATVVNISLGGSDFPGLDPVEEAVNRLTAEHGTLFVVAAGNTGQFGPRGQISSPGTAEAALTVGAVDRTDALADFSSRGPTLDGALKPDLTAPGVGIVAARVPGTPVGDTDPVDERYARASGTSMATPHVAGAAAILGQQYPQWRAGQLKAALMGSATSSPALTAYQQGAGRLDVARVIRQTVTTAPTSLALGVQRWPHADDSPVVRIVTYRNSGPVGVTLAIRVEATGPGGRAPAGMFTTGTATLTVPARGEASITLTADTRVGAPDGVYTGRVVASAAGTTVGTPFAIEREVESYDLTIRAIDRGGAPTASFFGDLHAPIEPVPFGGEETVVIRLPRGEYPFGAFVIEADDVTVSLLGAARHAVTTDSVLTLDARTAKRVEVVPPRDSAGLPLGVVAVTGVTDIYGFVVGVFSHGGYDGVFTGHIGPTGDPARFTGYVFGDWAQPGAGGDFVNSPYVYHLTWFSPGRAFDGLARRPRHHELATVRAEHRAPPGRVGIKSDQARPAGVEPASPDRLGTISMGLSFALPLTRTEYYTTEGIEWLTDFARFDANFDFEVSQGATWHGYRAGAHHERWGTGVLGPALPRPWFPGVWVRQFPDVLLFAVPMFCDATPTHYGSVRTDTARTVLYRDGTQVAESTEDGFVRYEAPAAAAAYRVDTTVTQSVLDTSTEIRGSWRFRSRPVAGPGGEPLPAMAIRFRPPLDSANRAPGGRPYAIPVTVERHAGTPGARIVSLTVDVSYDDGRSWRRVPLVPTPGGGWLAPVLHPDSGFVSLRARAVDADGNSVEQTIIRGYGLR